MIAGDAAVLDELCSDDLIIPIPRATATTSGVICTKSALAILPTLRSLTIAREGRSAPGGRGSASNNNKTRSNNKSGATKQHGAAVFVRSGFGDVIISSC
jgi:hypothetical protein